MPDYGRTRSRILLGTEENSGPMGLDSQREQDNHHGGMRTTIAALPVLVL